MPKPHRLSLGQLFFSTAIGVGAVTFLLLWGVQEVTRVSIVTRSEALRAAAAGRVEKEVLRSLGEAASLVDKLEAGLRSGALSAATADDIVRPLYAELLSRPHVDDIAFTSADFQRYDAAGTAQFASAPRWQAAVFREAGRQAGLSSRIVRSTLGGNFEAHILRRTLTQGFAQGSALQERAADPTDHPTFSTPVSKSYMGRALWSDLHYTEGSNALPEAQRPVVMTVQKALVDAQGHFSGVLRVGLEASVLRAIAKLRVNDEDPSDPHRVFLCDPQGRLLTPLAEADRIVSVDDDLRIAATHTPASMARALKSPLLTQARSGGPTLSEAFTLHGHRYLLSVRAIGDSQEWLVGIVVPENYYTADLKKLRDRTLMIFGLAAACALAISMAVLHSVRGGLRSLTQTTVRMRDFNFAPEPLRPTRLQDVWAVSESLERAKTALRAMGRYVPIDLVRNLYQHNVEPKLGGTLSTVTLMFTDIEGFTTLSETLPPNALAQTLGAYLQAMTDAIRTTQGTIDKFIGDAVMALWNAPQPLENHAAAACQAVILCEQATQALYASPAWEGQAPLVTRFGLHCDQVLVGHFGAPARMSFTALGDGVNLASRLEGLCKQYHVRAVVSGAVRDAAQDAFEFRRLDRVAVKGKSQAVDIYALCLVPKSAVDTNYEVALDLYWQRQFAAAAQHLAAQLHDPPSAVLAKRCADLMAEPPPAHWDGVWVAVEK